MTLALVPLEKSLAPSSGQPKEPAPGICPESLPCHQLPFIHFRAKQGLRHWLTWTHMLSLSHSDSLSYTHTRARAHVHTMLGTPLGLGPTASDLSSDLDCQETTRNLRMIPSSAAGSDFQHLRPSSSQNCLCPRAPDRAHPLAGSSWAGRSRGSKSSKAGVCEQRGLAPLISC